MATFLKLYGDRLDVELGTADRSQLFTLARRKAAVNHGIQEFARLTKCYRLTETVTLIDEQSDYDLSTLITTAFLGLVPGDRIELALTDASANVVYLSDQDCARRSVAWLDRYEPGWRGYDAATPMYWCEQRTGSSLNLSLVPAPDLTTAWASGTMRVPYASIPADLTGDTQQPYEVAGVAPVHLLAYHQAAVHYAAAELEKLRKGTDASKLQQQYFSDLVDQYLAAQRPTGGQRVTFARDYRSERAGVGESPRGVWADPRR